MAIAALLATRLSVTIAGSLILYQAHIISDTLFLAMIITSVLSAFIFPPIFHWLSPSRPQPRRDILLIGPKHWTRPIASQLESEEYRVYAYEDGSEAQASASALEERIRVIALLGPAQWERNIEWGARLQGVLHPDHIIVDVPAEARERAEAAGLTPFVAALASMQLLEAMIRTPLSSLVERSLWSSMLELQITSPSAFNRSLRDLKLPEDSLVIGIARDREHLIPRGSTVLRQGDTITIVCPQPRRQEIRHIFESSVPY
jgi:hypothetical protein